MKTRLEAAVGSTANDTIGLSQGHEVIVDNLLLRLRVMQQELELVRLRTEVECAKTGNELQSTLRSILEAMKLEPEAYDFDTIRRVFVMRSDARTMTRNNQLEENA